MRDDFYIGYELDMPSGLARRIRRAALAVVVVAGFLAVSLAVSPAQSSTARFHYGEVRSFEGQVVEEPYPALEAVGMEGDRGWSWLVGPGKHGIAKAVEGLEGRRVRLRGTLIERDGDRMIEVIPASITPVASPAAPSRRPHVIGTPTVFGEIVDSKCHLGVMKPGEGATHRDCAVRCLLGQIPPLLMVRAGVDLRRVPLIIVPDPALTFDWTSIAGRPVRVRGTLLARGAQRFLAASPAEISVLESPRSPLHFRTLLAWLSPSSHH